jgi:predicted Na+-dependent transporter
VTVIRRFIESRFSLVLLLSCAAGLFVPYLDQLPDVSASIALALLTYASCFRLRDGGVGGMHPRALLLFYILRYMLLPLLLFVAAQHAVPGYALGVYLLALVPAAVASPAFSHLFGGSVPPAFVIVVFSTLLAPLMIPLQFALFADADIAPSPLPLFRTLVFCVFLPILLYAATRRLTRWGGVMYENGKLISILLVAFVIALVIAKQRGVILADPSVVFLPLALAVGLNTLFMCFGIVFGRNRPPEEQVMFVTCSGFSNVALEVSLALLHFSPPVVLLVAVSEIAWALLPLMMQGWMAVRGREAG